MPRGRAPARTASGRRAKPARRHLHTVPPSRRPRPRGRLPFLIAAFSLTAVLVVGVVSLQALVSQTAFRMQDLQHRIQQLEQRTDELRLEAAQLSSPERVEHEAHRLGFVYPPPDDVHTIVVRTRSRTGNGAPSSLFALEQFLGSAP
jgi:cell division protein FtsL